MLVTSQVVIYGGWEQVSKGQGLGDKAMGNGAARYSCDLPAGKGTC